MGRKSLFTMVMVVVVVSILVTRLRTESLESVDVQQHPSSYHLTILKRSVDKIKRSWVKTPKSHVFKRSTDSQADDLLLNSLASYCTNFQADPKIAKHFQQVSDSQPLRQRDITGFTRFKPGKERHGMEPKVFPIKVWAQRENDKVWIIFEIAHSDTAVISRVDPFNFQELVLESPEEAVCQKIVSKVRFSIDSSSDGCKIGEDKWKDSKAIFQMTSREDSHYTITARVDLCKYDKSWNYNYNYHGPLKPMVSGPVSYPTFRIIPDPGDFVLIENGKDLSIDLHVNYSYSTHFSMDLVLWDWTTEKMLHSSAWFPPNKDSIKTNYDNENIFTVDVLNKTTGTPVTLSLRITLTGASGKRSGKLYFSNTDKYSGSYPYMSMVIPKVSLHRTIEIKLPDRPQVLPDDLIYLGPRKRFLCDANGDKMQDENLGFGKNCTVRCQAFGRDITSLYITKLEPIKSPVRSTSYIQQNRAVAILDVGPSSGDVEGDYRCVAVDRRGQTTTQHLQLYTSLFTKIKSFELKLYDTDTPHITCSVSGDKTIAVSIVVSVDGKNETRLDTDDRYERNITRNGDEMILTMIVPWEDLKVPKNRLICSAKGNRGDDSKEKDLFRYVGNRQGIYAIVERREFNVTYHDNGTISFTCFASGIQPIDMEMTLMDYSRSIPADLGSGYPVIKTTATYDDRVSMTYTVPGLPRYERYAMECKATNHFYSDHNEFYLHYLYTKYY